MYIKWNGPRRIAPGFLRHLPSTHVPRVVHLLTRSRPPRDRNLFQFKTRMFYRGFSPFNHNYRKPPTISPGLIHFRTRFLMGLYKGGGGLYTGGANTWMIFCVSNKQVRHKQVSHKQENRHVLFNNNAL